MVKPSIINDLLERGHEFSFPQVFRLARAHLGPDALEQNRVRIRPKLSLAFPAADVDRVEISDDGAFLVTASFGGLYGSDSPLPTFETEDLFDDQSNDRTTVRDFLDIIHQRLYYLYAASWSKYRTLIRIVEEQVRSSGDSSLNGKITDTSRFLREVGSRSHHTELSRLFAFYR